LRGASGLCYRFQPGARRRLFQENSRMTATRRPLIAGNWKMNGLRADLVEIETMTRGCEASLAARLDLIVCPPATLLAPAATIVAGTSVRLGGQDCHARAGGAHTGDVAAEMLADLGAAYVIVGHSERRADHGETDAVVLEKARAALRAGLIPIICVGETLAQREAGRAREIVGAQIEASTPPEAPPHQLVIAYEPVWAIGSGLTPTVQEVADMHALARDRLEDRLGKGASLSARVLYGGSVKPNNAAEILALPAVDGALVGGASLKAQDFLAIARACP
jgi:triosephosphate isomerase (TIM)